MHFLAISLVILCAATPLAAQRPGVRYYVVPEATRLLQDPAVDSVLRSARDRVPRDSSTRIRRLVRDSLQLRECPMPVGITDVSRLAPMPVFTSPLQRPVPMAVVDVMCRNRLLKP